MKDCIFCNHPKSRSQDVISVKTTANGNILSSTVQCSVVKDNLTHALTCILVYLLLQNIVGVVVVFHQEFWLRHRKQHFNFVCAETVALSGLLQRCLAKVSFHSCVRAGNQDQHSHDFAKTTRWVFQGSAPEQHLSQVLPVLLGFHAVGSG